MATAIAVSLSSLALAFSLTWPVNASNPSSPGLASYMLSEVEALWPIEVTVTIRDGDGAVLFEDVVVTIDGEPIELRHTMQTSTGDRAFDIDLIARAHRGDRVELDYRVDVTEARFEDLEWSDYLLHRLSLGPRPAVGDHYLAASRGDVLEVKEHAHREQVSTPTGTHEIAFRARLVRG